MHYYDLNGESRHEVMGVNGKIRPTTIAAITGFPDYYISVEGIVISLKWGKYRELKQHKHRQGYMNVHLCVNGIEKIRYVHRLMAEAFLESWDPALQVNHINGVKDDNRLDNFDMVTNGGNQKHAFSTGLQRVRKGYLANKSKLTKDQYMYVLDTVGDLTARQVSETIPLCLESIRRIRLNHRKGVSL